MLIEVALGDKQPVVDERQSLLVQEAKDEIKKPIRNWSIVQWGICSCGTIFLLNTVMLVGCIVSGCYGGFEAKDKSSRCDSECPFDWIIPEVITAVALAILCCMCYRSRA